METLLYILGGLVYFSSFYLHRLFFRALGELANVPAATVWLLSASWPLVDFYLAMRINLGVFIARKR